MHVTARADYATRAAVELVDSSQERPSKMDAVAQAQGIPPSFLENILKQLRSAGVVRRVSLDSSVSAPGGADWACRWWLMVRPFSPVEKWATCYRRRLKMHPSLAACGTWLA
jgi:Iron-dependent Transcriptional regulator